MCDTNTSKDDDDIDIYSELPNFKYDENLLKLEGENKALKTTVAELMKKIESLEIQLKSCEKANANYRRNISSLFLTAQREINRKDRTISELRSRSSGNFQDARRDFQRRIRSDNAERQISRNLDSSKCESVTTTSETNVPKKIGYCFTAGNTRSGLYKCNYPAKDSKTVASSSSYKSNSKDSVDRHKTVFLSSPKDSCSKVVNTVANICSIGQKNEPKASSFKNTDDIEDNAEENERIIEKVGREQTGTYGKRRSPIIQDRRKSSIISDERKPIASSRSKSPINSNRRKSPRTSDKTKSSRTSSRRQSPIASSRSKSPRTTDRRKSPRTSVRRDVDNRSGGNSRREHLKSHSVIRRNIRSGSVMRRDIRLGSVGRSSTSSTVGRNRNRDSVIRVVRSSQKSPIREKEKIIESTKWDLCRSEVKRDFESQAIEFETNKSVVTDGNIKASSTIAKEIDPKLSSAINVVNQNEAMLPSDEKISVDQPVEVVNATELKSPDKSMRDAVDNEKASKDEEVERIRSLPPLVGPWTQFSVRRYKKLHGFSPVKPNKEEKKIVNIKYIEKKNLFNNKIEKIVITDFEGKTTREILNMESDKDENGTETNKILQSSSEGKTTNENEINKILLSSSEGKTTNENEINKTLLSSSEGKTTDEIILSIESGKNGKELESNNLSESLSAFDSYVSNDSDIRKEIPSNTYNQKPESRSISDSCVETQSKAVVNLVKSSSTLDSKEENQSTHEVSFKNSADDQLPTDLHPDSNTNIANKISNSILTEISVPTEISASSCIGNDKPGELVSEKYTESQLLVSNKEEEYPVINMMCKKTSELTTGSVKESVKENSDKLELILELEEECDVNSEGSIKSDQDTKVGKNDVNVTSSNQLLIENEGNKINEICGSTSDCEQLKLSTENEGNEKIGKENENASLICENVLLSTSIKGFEKIGESKTCSATSTSDQVQSSCKNEVLKSGVEGQNSNSKVEKLCDKEIHSTDEDQGLVESKHFKEAPISDSVLNAFEKFDCPEIDESPTYKSESKLTFEKPKIIDNISSSLHTFNSALDFSISTTNTNSFNNDGNVENERHRAQLSASSLQVVNALKKLPKIRENFLQLFGESSNQDNQKDSEPEENKNKQFCGATSATSNKELKSLSLSLSSSSSSPSSSLITQEKSSECTIPPVIRLFGIDITEEHSPFHLCKSSSQNSVVDENVNAINVQDAENNLKTTKEDNRNKSDIIATNKSDSVAVTEQVDAVSEKKTTEVDHSLAQITFESKKISQTNISFSEAHCQKNTVISKEIICEEPVVFPVPIVIVDKVSSNEIVSSQLKENKVTGEYYSNFTEALRKETNVSSSKTDLPQPEFQFESPSRYIMRINNNSVTSHKGLENTESQSIIGEDTLTMVRRLAKPFDTVSPIKTPCKRSASRNPKTSPDNVSDGLVGSKNDEKHTEKKVMESDRSLKKISNEEEKTGKKVTESEKSSNKVAKEEIKTNLDIIAKQNKVSVSLCSEHFEFKRRRSSRPIVKLKSSTECLLNKQDNSISPELVNNQQKDGGNQPLIPLKKYPIQERLFPPRNDPNPRKRPLSSPKNASIQGKSALSSQTDAPSGNDTIKGNPSPSRNDSIQGKSILSSQKDSPSKGTRTSGNDTIQENPTRSPPRNTANQGKRLPSPSRNDLNQETPRFKRRRVVMNRLSQNDLIKLGSPFEKTKVKTREQTYIEKNRAPVASTSGIGRQQSISVSANLKTSVKRMNADYTESNLVKQEKGDDLNSRGVNEARTRVNIRTNHRQRYQGNIDLVSEGNTKLIRKVVDNAKPSKSSGITDMKTDFCERRSPSEYFNRRSMNRRNRGSLRERKLQRCRSPVAPRRRVDKHLMKMGETRQRSETRSSRFAERSVMNDGNRKSQFSSDNNCIEWKLKPLDFKQQKTETLFERFVAGNVLEKLEKRRTFVIANPMEATPPPCHSGVLVDQSNRSNQVLSPEASHRSSASTLSTPKTTNFIPETPTSNISAPKVSQSNKIVIIRRKINNSPKVLGDSVGTFMKTTVTQNDEGKTPIVIRREKSNVSPRKLEDSLRCQIFDKSAKLSPEKVSTSNMCNENKGNGLKKEVQGCEMNIREIVGATMRTTRIVKTQLDFRSRLRRNRK